MPIADIVRALPPTYVEALRRALDGEDEAALAVRLDLAPEAVPPLVRLAAAKLARLFAEPEGPVVDP